MTQASLSSRSVLSRHGAIGLGNRLPVAVTLLVIMQVLISCGVPPRASVATPAPAPTLPPAAPLRSMVSIAQAWGPNAAAVTFSTQLDATHFMPSIELSPDGRSLYGYDLTLAQGAVSSTLPGEAGYLTVASHQFTSIGVASLPKCVGNPCQPTPGPALLYLHCCQTDGDGRFLVALSTGYPGPDCGGCLWAYDLRTGTVFEVASGNQFQGIETTLIDHGTLVFSSGTGVVVADLVAHSLTRLAGTTGGTQLDAFSWPYLVYGTPSDLQQQTTTTPTPVHVYDVATGASTPLPQVRGTILALTGGALYYLGTAGDSSSHTPSLDVLDNLVTPGYQPRVLAALPSGTDTIMPQSLAVAGDSLFYTVTTGIPQQSGCLSGAGLVCPTPTPAPPPVTTLYEVDHYASAPRVRAVAAYAAGLGGAFTANTRLVVLGGAAWDRAENRFVDLGISLTSSEVARRAMQDAKGNFLMIAQPLTQDALSPLGASIYDATHLPVLGG
jgi:hypothetical protein